MTKFDYYANHEQRRTFKWLGIGLGAIFSSVLLGAALLIVYMTREARASQAAAPVAVAAPAVPAPVVTPVPAAPSPVQPVVASASRPHKAGKSVRHVKPARALTKTHTAAILAKHDSRSKRKAKDDLDRMLGL